MRFWSLRGDQGETVSYANARELQLTLLERRAADECPDTILFLEHDPVITRGRGLQFTGAPRPRHMPVPVALPPGIEFSESERGGDLTYHGPGQLVVYPIVKLDGSNPFAPHHDVTGFLRRFEQIFIDELASRGLNAEARENATGVWVGEKKVASIGIAVRKWVTYHGIAINVVNDLAPFSLISPCGFAPEVMARLSDLIPGFGTSAADWRTDLEHGLASRIEKDAKIERITLSEALR
ncbi:MAG: lipoyl(octanoyl) transferase LipB [Oligoflexia bacterium]|nr:lipoyl(octanoyl) transferase LipB [Oligoflexia bacterium]